MHNYPTYWEMQGAEANGLWRRVEIGTGASADFAEPFLEFFNRLRQLVGFFLRHLRLPGVDVECEQLQVFRGSSQPETIEILLRIRAVLGHQDGPDPQPEIVESGLDLLEPGRRHIFEGA